MPWRRPRAEPSAIQEEARSGLLSHPDLPEDPSHQRALIGARAQAREDAKGLRGSETDKAFLFGELGKGGAPGLPQEVPGFADRAAALTADYIQGEEAVLADEEGNPNGFGDAYLDALIDLARCMGVQTDPEFGSRALYSALMAVFHGVLQRTEQDLTGLLAEVGPKGQRLHDLFYRPQEGTAGAPLVYPAWDEGADDIHLHAPGPVEFAVGQMGQPATDHLLATAAFEPDELEAAIREIAALSATEAEYALLRTRKKSIESEAVAMPLDVLDLRGVSAPSSGPGLNREEAIELLVQEYGIDPRDAEIAFGRASGEHQKTWPNGTASAQAGSRRSSRVCAAPCAGGKNSQLSPSLGTSRTE